MLGHLNDFVVFFSSGMHEIRVELQTSENSFCELYVCVDIIDENKAR